MTVKNSLQLQFDLFNDVSHIGALDIGNDFDVKIFDYSDDLKFDDKMLEDNFIINVPMYRIEDILMMMHGEVSTDKVKQYFDFAKNKKLNHCLVRITDKGRYGCGDKWYVLANAKTKKFVQQQTIVAILKNNISKKLKTYTKCVRIEHIDYRKDIKRNFVQAYIQSKYMTEHVMSQVS